LETSQPRGPQPIQDILAEFLKQAGLGSSPTRQRVFEAWQSILGEAERQRSQPVRFQRGELLVEVDSAPLLHELANFRGDAYRRRANERLGKETIRKIVFKLRNH